MKQQPKGRPFQKGVSGNPAGRPKKQISITALIREALAKTKLCGMPVPGEMTAAQALAEMMVLYAIKGEAPFMREVVCRVDGMLSPSTENEADAAARFEQLLRDAKARRDIRVQVRDDKPAEEVIDVEARALPSPAKPKKKARKS